MRSVMAICLALLLSHVAPALAQNEVGDDLSQSEISQQKQISAQRLIRTLQLRLFAKFARFEFSISGGIIPNDPFTFYIPTGLRVGYHFNEAFAVELASAYLGDGLRAESDLRSQLSKDKQDRTRIDNIKLLDQQVVRADVVAMWSPIFGKVAVMNDGLVHFDFNVVGGVGYLMTESENEYLETEFNHTMEAVVGAGFKFYFGGRFAARADFRQFIYGKNNGGTANPSEISLGFSVFTN